MRQIPLSTITIPPHRQRRQFDETSLSELAQSIGSIGLLHPIVVREGNVLVAGERRFRALQLLEALGTDYSHEGNAVPCQNACVTDLGSLSPTEAFEAELEENIRRVDLSWQEKEQALASLAKLKTEIAHARGEPTPTQAQIAAEESIGPKDISIALSLTSAMAANPSIAKAATRTEALKLMRRVEQTEVNRRLGLEVGMQSASELHSVIHADAQEWLYEQPSDTYDCILIDPPYGMNADSFGGAAGKMSGIEHSYVDSHLHAMDLLLATLPEMVRIMKPQSHLYIYCDIDGFPDIRAMCVDLGLWTFRTPLIHLKREGGRVPWPQNGPRRSYELVLYAVKGKREVTAIYPDVFDTTLESANLGHGAQKPVEGYVNLLKRTCRPGDKVLDCFAGTGTILAAAHQLQLRATAVEKDVASYGICVQRLKELA